MIIMPYADECLVFGVAIKDLSYIFPTKASYSPLLTLPIPSIERSLIAITQELFGLYQHLSQAPVAKSPDSHQNCSDTALIRKF